MESILDLREASSSSLLDFLLEDDFVALQKRSFANRSDRTNLFVDKLIKGDPIDLTKGEKVVIDKIVINGEEYSKANFEDLKLVLPTLTAKDSLKFFSGNDKFNISAFAKTSELGGKGKGGTLGPERKALGGLQERFAEIGEPITLSVGGVSYEGITGVINVKENQKADFAFTRGDDPVIFISYKPGSSAKDMISYGGITSVKSNPEVASFIEAVKAKTDKMVAGGVEYGAPVTDEEVVLKALFGSQYEEGSPGLNSVQAIVQGSDLKLEGNGDKYTLTASKMITPSIIPTSGEYAPYYNARYADDRSQFGIKNCRFNIVPMGARKSQSPFQS